ncbi:hypothetical protein CRYUN_Cryun23aG0067600 [Craigia yunnanensis]
MEKKSVMHLMRAAVELIAFVANFNLIVIDMLLPVLNGLERWLIAAGVATGMRRVWPGFERAWGAARLRKLLLIPTRERQSFLAAGVDEFIEKPLSPDNLVSIPDNSMGSEDEEDRILQNQRTFI